MFYTNGSEKSRGDYIYSRQKRLIVKNCHKRQRKTYNGKRVSSSGSFNNINIYICM